MASRFNHVNVPTSVAFKEWRLTFTPSDRTRFHQGVVLATNPEEEEIWRIQEEFEEEERPFNLRDIYGNVVSIYDIPGSYTVEEIEIPSISEFHEIL